MFSSLLIRKQAKRMFSTFSQVNGSAIFVSTTTPPRIKIPISDSKSLDYAINKDSTVQEFTDQVKSENPTIREITLGTSPEQKLEDLIQKRFEMKVNHSKYTVHPNISTMVKLKNRRKVEEILGEQEIPLVSRSILAMFLDHLVTNMPKDTVSKQQLRDILEKAVAKYDPGQQDKMLANIREEIKLTEAELDALIEKRKEFINTAKQSASNMLLFGVSMAFGQVGCFGYLIYGLFSWDEMEPVTYLVGAFYAWVSMLFYFRYKGDWEWASAYETFYERKLQKLQSANNVEDSRIEFLERYRDLLKTQLAFIEQK